MQKAVEAGVKRVVIASSAAVYGSSKVVPVNEDAPVKPLSPYALSKYTCEHYARIFSHLYGLETVSLRYFNVFGPNQDPHSDYSGVISKFVSRMSQGKGPIIYGDGEQTRDFVYVSNVVEANLLAATSPKVGSGEVINIGSGKKISINELTRTINRLLGRQLKPIYQEARQGDVRHSCADITKGKIICNYSASVL